MNEESFLKMIYDLSRTEEDLRTVRTNAQAKGRAEFVRVTEQELDRRFPSWRSSVPAAPTKSAGTRSIDASTTDAVSFNISSARPRTDLVAIVPPISLLDVEYAKQVLLLFDRIAVDLGANGLPNVQREALRRQQDFQWLRENGLLTTVGSLVAEKRGRVTREVPITGMDLMGDVLGKNLSRSLGREAQLALHGIEGMRFSAGTLRKMYGLDAILVSPEESLIDLVSSEKPDEYTRRDLVFRVTLGEFPMPSDGVAWESIIEFKTTRESQRYMSLLRQWINKTVSKHCPQHEIRDEIRELQFQYEEALHLHKVKSTTGALEVLVTVAAEVAEDLVKFKFGDAAKAVFNIKREHVKLVEAEMGAPGREVAYIVRARKQFQR